VCRRRFEENDVKVQTRRRVAFIAALVVMVGAGRWLLLDASVPQVAAGTWASAGGFGPVPDGAASATLADGRMVIAGGRYDNGTLVSQIGIFNPATQSWDDGGQLAMARTGHAAAALSDGRVLFAGGITANGVTSDVEVYDPRTGQSVHSGNMWSPRVNHAAASLGSVVFIAGGSDGLSFLDHVELFDGDTGQTESLAVRMGAAREKLSATTLLDGHVLIAGGRNDSGDLAIAEIFESGSRSIFPTGPLHAARSGHVGVLLPNNNQVLIAGGSGASAELYADWRNGFTVVPNPMTEPRRGAVAGALPLHDVAFVGGGGSPTGEYFGYATVKTDRADYWPGETVTITGSGWQPGERVALKISEDSDTHHDFTFTAVADNSGNIENREFAPIENEVFHHFGKRFYLTATGVASTALNTFTDGNSNVVGVVTSTAAGSPPISGATVTCTVANGCNNLVTTTTSTTGNYSLPVQFSGNSASITLTVSASGYTTKSESVSVSNSVQNTTKNFSLDPSSTATSTTVATSGSPSIYGNSVTFTATVSPSTATGSVQFVDGTTNLGSSVPVSGGQAALVTGALLAGSHSITAVFTGTGSFTGSTSPALVQVVNPKALTITATNQSKVYGTVMTPTGAEFTSSGLIGTDTVTSVTLTSAGYAQAASVADSPHTITPSVAVGSGLSNYTITYATGVLTVTARPVTVTADAKTKIYGAADPDFTQQVPSGSLVGSDGFSGALTRVAGENVGTYAIEQGTLTLGTNYTITFVSANLSITPATLTVTAQPQTKQYGNGDPALTYVTGGLKFTDTAASVLSGLLVRAPGESVAGGPYTITQGSLVANSNYTIAFISSALSITPATLTVAAEAKTKPYGDADPPLTYASSGYKFSDTAASVLTGALQRAAGETVAAGPYAIGQGTLGANTNYTIAFTGASLSITPAPLTVTAEAKNKEYGDDDPTLTYASSGYKFSDSAALVLTGTLQRATGQTVAGSPYAITQGSLVANSNYAIAFTGASLSITPAALTVTAEARSKEYGATDPSFTYLASGFKFSDTAASVLTGELQRVAGETVAGSPYAIGQGTLAANTNYTVAFTGASLTITARAITVTADPKNKTYGEADPALTYQVTIGTLVTGDNFSGSLSRVAGEDVGSYAIQQGGLALSGNYSLSFLGANLSITARAITVTADLKSKTYGEDDPALTYQVTTGSLVTGDAFSGALTRLAGENVGSYAIQQGSLALNGNYALTYQGAALTINKATPVISWTAPAAITYPTTLSNVQLSATANVPGAFVYTPAAGTKLNAGADQTLHVNFTPTDTGNYTTAAKDVLITVLRANQAITFGALGAKTFGDPPVPVGAAGGASGMPVTFQTTTSGVCSASPNGANAATVTIHAVGNCTVRASQAGNLNYEPAEAVDRSFPVGAWTAQGFYQPVGLANTMFVTAASSTPAPNSPWTGASWNAAKGGSTIPLKFNVFAGGTEVTSTANMTFGMMPISCSTGATSEDVIEEIATAGATSLRYEGVAGSGQFIQNWKTPAVKAEQCYRLQLTLPDASVLYTFVKLKK